MGVSTEIWRQRIGSFSPFPKSVDRHSHLFSPAGRSRVTPRWACVIAALLFIAGVELNPGPTKIDDVLLRIDDLMKELRDTRASLTVKIDDIATKVVSCETKVSSCISRLDALEQAHAALETQFTVLQGQAAAAPQPAQPAAASLPLAINDVVRELDMRANKKSNIVLSGILPQPPQTDAGIVTRLLHDELGIDAVVTRCTRLGKPSADVNRPCLLLATLASDTDAQAAIRAAKRLRSSSDNHVRQHVFLNADLTPEQRKLDFDLRSELKRRRSAGERDLVIRNGKVCTKQHQAASPTVPAPAAAGAARP